MPQVQGRHRLRGILRTLPIVCVLAASFGVWADSAGADPTLTLLSPADGASVTVTPPPGFGNGDVPLRWSIAYDCPGPRTGGFHTSNPEYREVGGSYWQPTARGGPFDGDGTFSAPANVFPQSSPVDYEWRIFWSCGAAGTFAGDQGYSEVRRFTLLPIGAKPPSTHSCAGLSGKRLARCKLKRAVERKCGSIKKKSKRARCGKRVRALSKCHSIKKRSKRIACTRKARKIGR